MIVKNLLAEYPELLEVCKKYDCNYEDGIKIIERKKYFEKIRPQKTLDEYENV